MRATCRVKPCRWVPSSDLREQNRSFTDIAAYFAFYGVGDNKMTGEGEPERSSAACQSRYNLFPLLGIQPQVGRLFTADGMQEEDFRMIALLSAGLCKTRFGSDPGIAGRKLTLNDRAFTNVLGVIS